MRSLANSPTAYILIVLFGLLCRFSAPADVTLPTPIVATSISANVDDLKAGDWLILDLDGTVFTEIQTLGRDQFYHEELKRLEQSGGMSHEEAVAFFRPINVAVKNASRLRLTERTLPRKILDLQSRGVHVIAITGRSPMFAQRTVRALSQFNIDFSKNPLLALLKPINWSEPDRWTVAADNIIYLDGGDKGLALRDLYQIVMTKPRVVKVFDDMPNYLGQYESAFQDLHINGKIYHFAPDGVHLAEEQIRIGEIELIAYLQQGRRRRILSDLEAARLIADGCELPLSTRFPLRK